MGKSVCNVLGISRSDFLVVRSSVRLLIVDGMEKSKGASTSGMDCVGAVRRPDWGSRDPQTKVRDRVLYGPVPQSMAFLDSKVFFMYIISQFTVFFSRFSNGPCFSFRYEQMVLWACLCKDNGCKNRNWTWYWVYIRKSVIVPRAVRFTS